MRLEEGAGLGLVLGDVGQVVEDEEVVRVELFDGGLEGELAAGDLELLDEVGGAGEEDAEAALDECQANAGGEVALAGARWADEYDVVPAGDPGVALGEGVDAGPREHGDGGEVEVGEGLSGRQARLGEVPANAPDAALGDLVLGERGEQPGRRPALAVGLFREARVEFPHGDEAEFAEQQFESGVVDGGAAHVGDPASSSS